jgi:hypothetical protein
LGGKGKRKQKTGKNLAKKSEKRALALPRLTVFILAFFYPMQGGGQALCGRVAILYCKILCPLFL